MTPVDHVVPPVRPSHWAYLRACVRLLEAGKFPTQVNLAAELSISKQAVWKFLRRWPDVMGFVDDQMQRANGHLAGLVVRRHAMLAVQGSVPSAELYLKAQGGHFARPLSVGDAVPVGATFNLNLLVPRPELPGLPAVVAQQPPAPAQPVAASATPKAVNGGLIPRPEIPRVHVR